MSKDKSKKKGSSPDTFKKGTKKGIELSEEEAGKVSGGEGFIKIGQQDVIISS